MSTKYNEMRKALRENKITLHEFMVWHDTEYRPNGKLSQQSLRDKFEHVSNEEEFKQFVMASQLL